MMKQINQLYNMLAGNAKLGQEKDGESDIISKLVYIESNIHHLIEVKEYLTGGLKQNDV